MRLIGLTGSIGMGKSTVARMLRRRGIPVFDADEAVHNLLRGQAYAKVAALFPESIRAGEVDRRALGDIVFNNPPALHALESILHPLVARQRSLFLRRQRRLGKRTVVLDIPLLFEKKLQRGVDAVLLVTAPRFVQKPRVTRRPGMTAEKFDAILARQMPDRAKRRLADVILHTGQAAGRTCKLLQPALKRLDSVHARNHPRYRNNRD